MRLGYCCINKTLKGETSEHTCLCCTPFLKQRKKSPIYCNRTASKKRLNAEDGMSHVKNLVRQNLLDVEKIIEWNHLHGIRFYRLSSSMFPHYNNPETPRYSLDTFQDLFERIGQKSHHLNHRLTFHPGQFCQLGTPHNNVLESTISELGMHAEVMDRMGLPDDSVMIVHGGGSYGDKDKTLRRLEKSIQDLPNKIKRRLVLENDEFQYSPKDLLDLCERCDVPLVLDFHHWAIHTGNQEVGEFLPRIIELWEERGIRPKFHVSDQKFGARTGAHADYVEDIPKSIFGMDVDLMIEAKHKELAVFKLYKKYPSLQCRVK